MYSFESRIRFSEVDETGHLTIASVINYFQDCTIFHAEEVGLGIEHYARIHKIWVLSTWQIQVNRFPKVCEKVTITTYPYAFKGFLGYRNFTITDEKGDICIVADSTWVYLDTLQNRPSRIIPLDVEPYGTLFKLEMDYKKGKIQLESNMDKFEPLPVLPSYVDGNHHMNNGQYVNIAQKYLPDFFYPTHLRVEYRNAAKEGDILHPMISSSESRCVVVLADEDEKPYAVMEFVS